MLRHVSIDEEPSSSPGALETLIPFFGSGKLVRSNVRSLSVGSNNAGSEMESW